jgi:hypothetical protein
MEAIMNRIIRAMPTGDGMGRQEKRSGALLKPALARGSWRATAIALSLLLGQGGFVAFAQGSLADEKTRAEIRKLEVDRQKAQIDALVAARSGIAGTASVSEPIHTAEGLLLAHHLQQRTAAEIARRFRAWRVAHNPGLTGPVYIAFGDQPPSIAEYLALSHGVGRLRENMAKAVREWDEANRSPAPRQLEKLALIETGSIMVALTAISTVASLLRVNTNLAGSSLRTSEEQFRAILLAALVQEGEAVEPPGTITTSSASAIALFDELTPLRDSAQTRHDAYRRALAAPDGVPANISPNWRVAGTNLATVLADHDALRASLYTPVNGVLPASMIGEQAALHAARDERPILYIYNHDAAMMTTTRQGMLSGIRGVPAFVSASASVDYAFAGAMPERGSVTVSTPVVRITAVRELAARPVRAGDLEQYCEARAAQNAPGNSARQARLAAQCIGSVGH